MKTTLKLKQKAFTMVELIVTVGLLGTLALIGVASYSQVSASAKAQKLKNDQATLNGSVNVYRGFGGKMNGLDDPEEVLRRLKLVSQHSEAQTIPGLSGSMLDPRVTAEWQTDDDAATDEPRLYWNSETMSFELATSGPPGISALLLNDEVPHISDSESRDLAFNYADESSWIWDFEDEPKQTWITPTIVQVTPGPVSLLPDGTDPTVNIPQSGPPALTLTAPSVSHTAGAYSIRDYDLPVVISNPNPAGSSVVYYSVDYGPWIPYTGALSLPPESIIQTMVVANEVSKYKNSIMLRSEFTVTPVTLDPPAVGTSTEIFGSLTDHSIVVTLDDPNVIDPSQLEYRINGGDWVSYTDPFTVTRQQFPNGVTVESRAVGDGIYAEYYNDSPITTRQIDIVPFTFAASSDGDFKDVVGGDNLVTNLTGNQSGPVFRWGEVNDSNGSPISGLSQSWLSFMGIEDSPTEIGSRVELGTLEYYNGSIRGGSGADNVTLDMDLELNIAGQLVPLQIDFLFDLVNVPNDGNANSPDYDLALASADFVRVGQNSLVTPVIVAGFHYNFLLELGDSSGAGFSNFSEFHVLENRDATTKIFGTFEAVAAPAQ